MRQYSFLLALLIFIFCFNVSNVYASSSQDLFGAIDEALDNQNENIDSEVMQKGTEKINSTVGVLLSFIIYIIFALTAFTTACDLMYIGLPALRPYLYSGSNTNEAQSDMTGMGGMSQQAQSSSKSKVLISTDLQRLLNNNNNVISLKLYLKERSIAIIIDITILLVLVSSTIFTDIGLNIGQLLYEYICYLLGIS